MQPHSLASLALLLNQTWHRAMSGCLSVLAGAGVGEVRTSLGNGWEALNSGH